MSATPAGPADPRSGAPVYLVGFMGAGKTSVGERLAAALGREFVDLDRRVESALGRTIETYFREQGEAAFRDREWEALQALGDARELVVAAGGGLYTQYRARRWMRRRGATVWLDVPLAELRRRVGEGKGRPVWAGLDPGALEGLYARRRAAYALADLRVDGRGDPGEVATRILEQIFSRSR